MLIFNFWGRMSAKNFFLLQFFISLGKPKFDITSFFLGPFCSPFLQSSAPAFGQITLDHAVHYADLCAKELGCDEEQDVLACMQSRDIKDIIRSMTYIMGGNPK